jgi:uncharacterized repeat protein (TIGR01451 family)
VEVGTTCHGSGRGSPNQYYLACWTVGFAPDGHIDSKTWLATHHWVQGHPALPCPTTDPAAVYTHADGAGNFPATLSTARIGTTNAFYRAVLETTCAPIKYGDAASGSIGAPGEEACYSFSGAAGDGVHIGLADTSGSLLAVPEVRGPDGDVLCGAGSGALDCTLAISGLHTIVVRDAAGTATGGYDLSLACLTCNPGQPHLTIGMTATVTPRRFTNALDYAVNVANDGQASAADVVVEDSLPQGLFVRNVSTTQGTCSHVQRAVTCTVGPLAPSQTVQVTIATVLFGSPDAITNTACVDTDNCVTTVTEVP